MWKKSALVIKRYVFLAHQRHSICVIPVRAISIVTVFLFSTEAYHLAAYFDCAERIFQNAVYFEQLYSVWNLKHDGRQWERVCVSVCRPPIATGTLPAGSPWLSVAPYMLSLGGRAVATIDVPRWITHLFVQISQWLHFPLTHVPRRAPVIMALLQRTVSTELQTVDWRTYVTRAICSSGKIHAYLNSASMNLIWLQVPRA